MNYNVFPVGTVVQVCAWPFHVGIATDRFSSGGQTFISASRRRGMVAEEALAEFSGGLAVKALGYYGHLPPSAVVARARLKLGTPWRLLDANCEHFVRWAHGVKIESPHLQFATILIATVGLSLLAAR